MTSSDFLVSVGVADVDGEQIEGIGLHRKGESSLWFLPFHAIDEGARAESTWVQVRISAYTPTSDPLDERLIAEPGVSGHRYVLEVLRRKKSPDTPPAEP